MRAFAKFLTAARRQQRTGFRGWLVSQALYKNQIDWTARTGKTGHKAKRDPSPSRLLSRERSCQAESEAGLFLVTD
jgi:hypothetical protein